jgi:hypothetical protein
MISYHKAYYNPNYTNLNKKSPNDICPKPKNLYNVYKLNNVKQKKLETKF